VGVIRALEQAGIHPEIVCGTSVGALVAAAYAAGELDRFEQWLLGMRLSDVVGFMDVNLGGGAQGRSRDGLFPAQLRRSTHRGAVHALWGGRHRAADRSRDLAADRLHGRSGASLHSLPALFTPVPHDGLFLVDGGLVNPVPVSLARAMGAEVVIAVDLSSDKLGRRLRGTARTELPDNVIGEMDAQAAGEPRRDHPAASSRGTEAAVHAGRVPVQHRYHAGNDHAHSLGGGAAGFRRVAAARASALLDFHRAREAIDEGKRAAGEILASLHALGNTPT